MRCRIIVGPLAIYGVLSLVVAVRAGEEIPLDKVPAAVMKAVKDEFPDAEVQSAEKEVANGKSTFEITLEEDDRDITMSLKEDGTILEIEKEVAVKDLPAAVRLALRAKYPDGAFEEAEEVTNDDGVVYEVVVTLGEKAARKVAVDRAGKITEDEEAEPQEEGDWTTTFGVDEADLASAGRNPYFILEPGYELDFEGREGGEPVTLTITVLDETKKVGNVATRVVEERETKGGRVLEISRNFFAICKRTNNVYYFGEDVDIYKDGKVVSHEGSWLAGEDGARFGLAMPGSPLLGARYHQEVAPKRAMDRAEVVSLSEMMETPAGKFTNVLKTEETTTLEPGAKEAKYYAARVGLLKDGPMMLVRHGFAKK